MAGIKNVKRTAKAVRVFCGLPTIVSALQVFQRPSPAVAIPWPLFNKPTASEATGMNALLVYSFTDRYRRTHFALDAYA